MQVLKWLRKDPLKKIFLSGVLLRLFVFLFQTPENNDKHLEVIQYIQKFEVLPPSMELEQSFHPPLYYALASLLTPLGLKSVQAFSLAFSVAALWIIYRLLRKIEWISESTKSHALFFASLLPQWVIAGNYISNDALAMFFGALVFFQMFLCLGKASLVNQYLLACFLGLGLLTKGTFLAFVPGVLFFVAILEVRKGKPRFEIMKRLLVWLIIVFLIGGYKFAENWMNYHQLIVHNLDTPLYWIRKQRPVVTGFGAFFDFNLLKLLFHPTVSQANRYSIPLIFYGTFWYQFVYAESFVGNMTVWKYLGSTIYVLGLVPTALFFRGFITGVFRPQDIYSRTVTFEEWNRAVYQFSAVLILFLNFALVMAAGLRYDVWSCFQSRLLFPSFFAILLCFASGVDISRQPSAIFKAMRICFGILYALFLIYFISEYVIWLRA